MTKKEFYEIISQTLFLDIAPLDKNDLKSNEIITREEVYTVLINGILDKYGLELKKSDFNINFEDSDELKNILNNFADNRKKKNKESVIKTWVDDPLLDPIVWQHNESFSEKTKTVLKETYELFLNSCFSKAKNIVRDYIKNTKDLTKEEEKTLKWVIERTERIEKNFRFSYKDVINSLIDSSVVEHMTLEDFNYFESKYNAFERLNIDGINRYPGNSARNFFFKMGNKNSTENFVKSMEGTGIEPENRLKMTDKIYKDVNFLMYGVKGYVKRAKESAKKHNTPLVEPLTLRAKYGMIVKENIIPTGAKIRFWIPVPGIFSFQKEEDFKILSTSQEDYQLHQKNIPQSTIYMETTVEKGKTIEAYIEYQYTSYGRYYYIDSSKVGKYDKYSDEYKRYTKEERHVKFTPQLLELAKNIVRNETNPYIKARKIYDWLTENVRYLCTIDYSTVPNISDFVIKNRYGDCGKQALTFVALCRSQGIPARFQSGRMLHNDIKNGCHDWAEILIPGYGWIPVDVNMGRASIGAENSYLYDYTEEERKECRDFYFGGLEPAMALNFEHCKHFVPEKLTFRQDDVDNQLGECEYIDNEGNVFNVSNDDYIKHGFIEYEIIDGHWPES